MSVDKTQGMECENTRFASFTQWPSEVPTRPMELAAAGFYYTGRGDKVTCFSCDLSLDNWRLGQIVWNEHQQHRPRCPFVQGNGERKAAMRDEADEADDEERGLDAINEILPELLDVAKNLESDPRLAEKCFSEKIAILAQSGPNETRIVMPPDDMPSPTNNEQNPSTLRLESPVMETLPDEFMEHIVMTESNTVSHLVKVGLPTEADSGVGTSTLDNN